jgi:(2Fe-2S) ferredoxin
MKYQKHVFICTNDKDAPKKCCGSSHGMELVDAFKTRLKELGVASDIRAQRAGCLDVCGQGPAIVVYPEGIFYGNVALADVDEIIDKHLMNNQVVERLQLNFEK